MVLKLLQLVGFVSFKKTPGVAEFLGFVLPWHWGRVGLRAPGTDKFILVPWPVPPDKWFGRNPPYL